MPTHISDSVIYQGSWGTAETRSLFEDEPRTRAWLEILAVLAESQAEVGLIPAEAAGQVAETCRSVNLDDAFFDEVRQGFEATNHSMLGLIRAIQRRCPGDSGEWFYYGTTVQDVTDTWMMMAIEQVWELIYHGIIIGSICHFNGIIFAIFTRAPSVEDKQCDARSRAGSAVQQR